MPKRNELFKVELDQEELEMVVSLLTSEARYRILQGEKKKHDLAWRLRDKIERGR